MAARKKKSIPPAEGVSVVLEDMRSQFKVFGEALQGFREEFSSGLQGLREEVSAGFEQVARRFEQVDHRFEGIDRELGHLKREVVLVKATVIDTSREVREIRGALEKKVDRDEVEAIVERVIARPRPG